MTCKHCDEPLTVLAGLRQPSPMHFKCPRCKTKHDVHAPGLKLIAGAVLILLFVPGHGFVDAFTERDYQEMLLWVGVLLVMWVIFEFFFYVYLVRLGRLSLSAVDEFE